MQATLSKGFRQRCGCGKADQDRLAHPSRSACAACVEPKHAEQLRHLSGAGGNVPEGVRQHLEGAAVAIWTTTGWTIPANQAVAVNERLQYAVVEAQACPLLTLH